MIVAYSNVNFKSETITQENASLLHQAIWIDLLNPSKAEEEFAEKILGLDIPTREEMREIEPSNRLYEEDGAIFMTATMIAKSDSPAPKVDAVTLIIKAEKLITVRYIEPQAFALFISRLPRLASHMRPINLIVELLEATIDRLADILESVGQSMDEYSQTIFRTQHPTKITQKLNYKELLKNIGANGDLTTKTWESLVSFNRLIVFFGRTIAGQMDLRLQAKLTSLSKDIKALSDHVKFLTTKVTFLLDATLGMVNIDQNNIIKIFSVVAVILLPPTLVASVYGMNFDLMPELRWRFGYPFALLLMFISAWVPYRYFKARKWL